ncbi:hypothetical protein AB8A31_15830 [Tardiphaga sp. 804_B3_N1_9]|uniref:hypothetical protein n=1 Tax=Tardiphaga sp. 804_B3_N1_9 TaxID=3240786 RepID=UPI003F237BF6
MNMFDDETPADVTKRVGDHVAEKIKTDLALRDFRSHIEDNMVLIKAPTGSSLDITCNGPDSFYLEDDKHTAHSGMLVTERAFSRNRHLDEKEMVSSVKGWFRQHGKR